MSHPDPDRSEQCRLQKGGIIIQQLTASEEPLSEIFSSHYDFSIPDYQRPYSWGADETNQLLDDLVDALDRNADEPYFLGSVVLVKVKASPAAEVIDGQQRLTTLTIMLSVLRSLTNDQSLADELGRMIVEPGAIVKSLAPRPRLALRSRDSVFFAKYVQEPGGLSALLGLNDNNISTDAQRAIRDNARALDERLSSWAEHRRLDLVQLLGVRTYLVIVSTPDLQSAYRIFSVMNARGLDLSPADIFKSVVIGALGQGGASEAYAEKWEDAEENLGRDGFAELFIHIRMIFAKIRAKRELLKEFPEQVLNNYLPTRAAEFVDDVVVPYADAYETMRDASFTSAHDADKVNAWLRRLAQLESNDWRPAVMWALRAKHDEPVWLDTFLTRLERLAASMLIRRVYDTPRSTRYAQLLTELDHGSGLDSPALDLSSEEKADTLSRLGGEVYLVTKLRKYVLLRLDDMLTMGAGATSVTYPLITVEHVLPQNPLGNSEWLRDFSQEERERWTHRLANLVLLSRAKNSEAQNYDYDKKKARYFTGKNGVASFALTSQVLAQSAWTPAVLERRQEEILATLTSGWRLA